MLDVLHRSRLSAPALDPIYADTGVLFFGNPS